MLSNRPCALIVLLDPDLDRGKKSKRWDRWRPALAVAQREEVRVARIDLLYDPVDQELADTIADDLAALRPGATIESHPLECGDAHGFETVHAAVSSWVIEQPFSPEAQAILVQAGARNSPASIALTAAVTRGRIPGRLLLISPPEGENGPRFETVDLGADPESHPEPEPISAERLPSRNRAVNALMDHIEKVAGRTDDPIVLHGAAGAGRSTVARWIHAIRRAAGRATGRCVEIDGIEIQDDAKAALFGSRRLAGAFAEAAGGTLIIEHVDALPKTSQVALARRLDRPAPDTPGVVVSLRGTLTDAVERGVLEDDLLAMLDGWVFEIPPLSTRPEDVEPSVDSALAQARIDLRRDARFEPEARERFLAFAQSRDASWVAGFRSLRASVRRMATLTDDGLITTADVELELERLTGRPSTQPGMAAMGVDLEAVLGPAQFAQLDRFDLVQLADVIEVCRRCETLSDAGRILFAASRLRRKKVNDADRVRKYLMRYGLDFADL